MSETFDVVIVGGGLAGLISAHLLLKKRSGIKIQVIETSDRVCSSLKTIELDSADGRDVYDIGVSRVGSAQPLMLALLKEFGIETFEHYDKGTKHWQLPDGKVKNYRGAIPPLPYTALIDLLRYFKKMDKLAAQVNMEDIPSTENCAEWDHTTAEQFMQKFLWTQSAKEMAATMVGTFCRMPPNRVPLLLYMCIIRSCGNWERHIGGEGTGRMDLKVKGGFEQLGRRLHERVGKDRVVLGDPVTCIEQSEDKDRATVRTKSGREFVTRSVIMAVPSRDICNLELVPGLSVPRTLPTGDYGVHFVVTYKKCFWREKKMAGELLSMAGTLGSFQNSNEFPLIAFFDHTSAKGNPALMGLFGSVCYAKMTVDERKQIAIDFVASILGDEARDIIAYHDECWSKQATGIEPCVIGDEVNISRVLDSLAKPHGCIHFAGEETGVVWAGMMESAADSASRVVKEILNIV